MIKVPMFNFALEHAPIQAKLEQAAIDVIRSGQFILGPQVEGFEQECAKFLGVRYSLGVSSGTDALLMALMALNIGYGDEVICPSFSFFATAGTISRVGAKPVFVDIDLQDFNINCKKIEAAITTKTKAIMPVHLFGQSADMTQIMLLAAKYKLHIIEDAAQAIGAKFGSGFVGTFGDIGCFSFFPTKNLGGFGDAGLVATNDENLYNKLKMLRNHGSATRYYHEIVGGNFRIDALQAALLRIKLADLPSQEALRKHVADLYISNIKPNTRLVLPSVKSDRNHTFNQFTIRVKDGLRDRLKEHLAQNNIESMIYYPLPIHKQTCYADMKLTLLPQTDIAASEVLSLPIAAHLKSEQLSHVCKTINQFFEEVK